MTLEIENGDGVQTLDVKQTHQNNDGYGWITGVLPSLDTGASSIKVDVTSGEVLYDTDFTTVSSDSVTVSDGDNDWPRRDLLYIDVNGNLQAKEGTPRIPEPEGKEGREAEVPELDDMSDFDGVVIASLWVPADATGPGDITESDHLFDRRMRPWPQFPSIRLNGADKIIGSNGTVEYGIGSNAIAFYVDGNNLYIERTISDGNIRLGNSAGVNLEITSGEIKGLTGNVGSYAEWANFGWYNQNDNREWVFELDGSTPVGNRDLYLYDDSNNDRFITFLSDGHIRIEERDLWVVDNGSGRSGIHLEYDFPSVKWERNSDSPINFWTDPGGANRLNLFDQQTSTSLARFHPDGNFEIPEGGIKTQNTGAFYDIQVDGSDGSGIINFNKVDGEITVDGTVVAETN